MFLVSLPRKISNESGIDSSTGHIVCFRCENYVGDLSLDLVRIKLVNETNRAAYPGLPYSKTGPDLAESESIVPPLSTTFALRGFVNMGSTCFMSSILQTFLHNPFVRDFFLSGWHSERCEKPIDECLTCCLDDIFKDFYTVDTTKGYGPVALLTASWKVKKSLAGYSEQDAHEFLQFILEEMHQSFEEKSSTISDCHCVTHTTFCGELQSSVTCSECGAVNITVDPMLDLSLELSHSKDIPSISLTECLNKFTHPEKLDVTRNCGPCQKQTPSLKQLMIKRIPPVLAIQLKRFEHLATSTKIENHVNFPLFLDMAAYTVDPSQPLTYELFAVVCHIGSVNTGHYVSMAKSRNGMWFKFDDEVVSRVTAQHVLQTKAYLLFYIVHQI